MASFILLILSASAGNAFQVKVATRISPTRQSRLYADTSQVENVLDERYPDFMDLLIGSNDEVWKKLREADYGYTIFAPNEEAFDKQGEKRLAQLEDPRNSETTEKMGAYHVVGERVTPDELFNSEGVITLGGEVPVERSTTGGFFGIGGKEDGGVTIGKARVLQSYEVGDGIIHEVDALISPEILWRYMDQLRIPGSK